jgi:serine/threonine protein kinase
LHAYNHGRVWRATDSAGSEVDLKIAEFKGDSLSEAVEVALLALRIAHPYLLRWIGVWIKNVRGDLCEPSALMADQFYELFIAFEPRGRSLDDLLLQQQCRGEPGIPPERLLKYTGHVAAALDFLHTLRKDADFGRLTLIRNDVKPHNIFLRDDDAVLEPVHQLGEWPGVLTPAYAAPELFRSEPSESSDQYSLAMTYVELRTGELPFEMPASSVELATSRSSGDDKIDLTLLPAAERKVLTRALSYQPDARYRTCVEFVDQLRQAQNRDARGHVW